MTEQQGGWGPATPPRGWLPPSATPHSAPPAMPAGMAPMGRPPAAPAPGLPPRPVYREPHPIAAGPLMAGVAATVLWFALFGALGRDLLTYAWWTVAAAISAWLVATFLGLFGDRGVAVGVAITSGVGLSIALGLVGARWITTSDWPLW
jgi:hypothetical protein